jgi:hypothetical protein
LTFLVYGTNFDGHGTRSRIPGLQRHTVRASLRDFALLVYVSVIFHLLQNRIVPFIFLCLIS